MPQESDSQAGSLLRRLRIYSESELLSQPFSAPLLGYFSAPLTLIYIWPICISIWLYLMRCSPSPAFIRAAPTSTHNSSVIKQPLIRGWCILVILQPKHLAVYEPEDSLICFEKQIILLCVFHLGFSFLSSVQTILQNPGPRLLSRQMLRPSIWTYSHGK